MTNRNGPLVLGNMKYRLSIIALGIFTTITVSTFADESNWPRFRGTAGSGVEDGTSLVAEFGPDKNLVWKTELPSGHSSPCIWGDYIFLTGFTATENKLETLAINRRDGTIIWRQPAPVEKIEKVHETSSPASPTPTTDGEQVYVYFGSYGLLCYDFEGELQWKKSIPMPKSRFGTAGSPVLVDDLVLLGLHNSKLLALNTKSGEQVWEHDNSLISCSYSVPLVRRTPSRTEVILHGSGGMVGLDASDGKSQWWISGLPRDPVPSPILGDGLLFTIGYFPGGAPDDDFKKPPFDELLNEFDTTEDEAISADELPDDGFVILNRGGEGGMGNVTLRQLFSRVDQNKNKQIERAEWEGVLRFLEQRLRAENAIFAIRPGNDGDVTDTNIVWRERQALPEIPSAIYYRGNLYAVKNGGIVTCLNGETGALHFRKRIGVRGLIYASPVAGDGKIFVSTLSGKVVVFEDGTSLNVLAKNDLGEPIAATPAIADGKIYIRSDKHLFAFGE